MWSPEYPTDDELLINSPGRIRANWEALQLMEDSSLLISNQKCASDMALDDSKLAQIVTAGKVSGTALTLLPNIPSGAGYLPTANLGSGSPSSTTYLRGDQTWDTPLNDKVKSSSDDTADYLDGKVAKSIVINSEKLELSGDSATPGNTYYYGTNSAGTKGYYSLTVTRSQLFTSTGTITIAAGVSVVYVTLVGGGGGGGKGAASFRGGGGGSGAFACKVPIPVTALSAYTVTVGAAGVAGVLNGTAGGSSSFIGNSSNSITVNGGSGGTGALVSAGAGGAGGSAGSGTGKQTFAGATGATGGAGAGSYLGDGGAIGTDATKGYGGGGGGGNTGSGLAGDGAAGCVLIEW